MSRSAKLYVLITTFALAVFPSAQDGDSQATSCLVTTTHGDVEGQNLGASCGFLGVPYADSTAGANRWRPPQPRAPWTTTLSAKTGSPLCSQLQPSGAAVGFEDCLFLNIWTRDLQPDSLAPVIVWFHTGGFTASSANFGGTNGRRFADETGTVVVAPNYRLGPMGFLAHSALAAEDPDHPTSGNYGLLDQRAALRWVRDNIAQFGGDPAYVTIAGTSAGGASAGLQLVSPGSAGLFHRAVVQSAYPTIRWTTHDEFVTVGDRLATALSCADPGSVLDCMRFKTPGQVLTALPVGGLQVVAPATSVFWEPIVDGHVIPDQPRDLFARGEWNLVPTIVGANRDEGWGSFVSPFITRSFPGGASLAQYEAWAEHEFGPDAGVVLAQYPAAAYASPTEAMAQIVGDGQFVCEGRRLARLISGQSPGVFLYSYEYVIPALSQTLVNHGVESHIVFGNDYTTPLFPPHMLTPGDQALHHTMAGYWSRFAATGEPGGDGDALWTRYGDPRGRRGARRDHMIFDVEVRRGDDLREAACDFWSEYYFRSMLGQLPAWGGD